MGLRQMVPASSRSFWQLYGEVETIRDELRAMRGVVDGTYQDVRAANTALEAHDAHAKLMLWEAMREEDESLDDTKKRFFRSLPEATGAARVIQIALAHLLQEFDQICLENDLIYWVACGTAVGALRHAGFVPWDDDIDLGMPRVDINKLREIVQDNPRYRVTVVYDRNVKCRQVRFRYADSALPCFLDLFLFDYVLDPDHATFDRMQVARKAFCECIDNDEDLAQSWNMSTPEFKFVKEEDERGQIVAAAFDEAVAGEYAQDNYLTTSRDEARGVMWGIDNLDSWDNLDWISAIEDVLPLQRLPFEGFDVYAMANIEGYLEEHYGDIYALPKDIKTHFSHIRDNRLSRPGTKEALEDLTGMKLW